ncbi:putative Phosphatidylserine synthase [Leptomonas seymouri]|uniref:Putative Phosphatidylserine synthase n=1 Tax=Leptomonas seymouri TaxID=5684 RepID=A0A0N1IIC0_LEPSE|nr:putative Phosphatidylserine synthase [Leptomonas seymouri]|eukprot:KPI83928.1 putative Phosphatidylserine synthase [Leptomonas seymouri]
MGRGKSNRGEAGARPEDQKPAAEAANDAAGGSGNIISNDGSKAGGERVKVRPPPWVPSHPLDSFSLVHRTDDHLKPASPWARELDFADRAYTPHTVAVLLSILMGILLMLRYYYYPNLSVVQNVKLGLSAAAFVFVGFGTVHLPDSLMVRPHPAVWRGVLALGILYLIFLTFMIFQDLSTVRAIMGFYDKSLLSPLPERAYAEDCRMSTAESPWLFVNTAFDMFILAHSAGYVVKMLVLRDWRVVTAVSLGFEVIEVTFQHVLPNFRECWWDHVLLDVLICNAGGTLVGMWLLWKLNAKEYKWIALKEINTMKGKAKRLLGQLGPRSFERYNWNVFQSPTRFFQVAGILLLMLLQELNCFTMKAVLQMQPEYHLVTARLALWALLATPCLRELYEFITNPYIKRIGTNAWVTILGICVETIWIAKMAVEGHYFQDAVMPTHIAVPWMVAIASLSVWLVLYFGVLSLEQRNRRRGLGYFCVNVFFYAAALCILGLFLMGLPDLQLGRHAFETAVAPYEKYIFFWR